ncbi:MAG: rhodanese-like domain-containing protein [Cyclobacteriaceae bacterium]
MRNLLLPFIVITLISCSSNAQERAIPTISPDDLKSKIESGEGVLLDVRRPDEIAKGVIKADVLNYNFSASDFNNNIAQLDKDETYYVYCAVGGRSGKTVQKMKEMGFENVYNVEGGIVKWQEVGNKLVKKKD